MKITAIENQAHNPERYNIYADGRFLMGINSLLVLQLGLQLDQELTPELLTELEQSEQRQKAIENALNFLSFRPRSRDEVKRQLRKKEFTPEIIEAAMEHLDHLNLVDDRAFSSFWKETREQFNPRGSRAIKNELRMKGVEREVVDEIITDENDDELALQAGRKRAPSLMRNPSMEYQTFRNRLGSFLQRRGFGYEIVNRTVRTIWEEERGSSEE